MTVRSLNASRVDLHDTVVVGAGPAGLAVSRHLTDAGHDHVVLERGRVGESWRSQRWDAFALNSPAFMNRLPGTPAVDHDAPGFPSRDGYVATLAGYAEANRLPIRSGVTVLGVEDAGARLLVRTDCGTIAAREIVAASGAQTRPRGPEVELPVAQLHSAGYRNAAALPEGAVLVVGGAQSGLQIAEDLLEAGRRVLLATNRVGRWPRRYRGRDIATWLDETGFLDATRDAREPATKPTTQAQISGTRGGHTLSLQQLAREGATLLGTFRGAEDGALHFAANLRENVAFADEVSARAKRMVDEHIGRHGIAAPAPEHDPAEDPEPGLPTGDAALDPVAARIGAVIWATGFRAGDDWLGETRAHRIGVPWLPKRKSGNLHGIREDSALVAEAVLDATARRRAA
jgi:putative flavoprotein involved in K+ transport